MAVETRAGQKTGFYLPKDSFCNVISDSSGTGLVCQYNDGILTKKYQIYSGSSLSIGPFNEDTTLEISALTGTLLHDFGAFYDRESTEPYFGYLSESSVSPHLLGFYPLKDQLLACIRDISGKENHIVANGYGATDGFYPYRADADGWFQYNSGGSMMGKFNVDPGNQVFDITGPGQSFIIHFQYKRSGSPAGTDYTFIAKGQPSRSAGARSLFIGAWDNSTTAPRISISDNNTRTNSANLTAGTVYNVCVVRDAVTNKIWLYLNGALDANFASGLSFNPTAINYSDCLGFNGYGTNLGNSSGAEAQGFAATGHLFKNLGVYITQPNVYLPSDWATRLVPLLNANPSYMLTAEDFA